MRPAIAVGAAVLQAQLDPASAAEISGAGTSPPAWGLRADGGRPRDIGPLLEQIRARHSLPAMGAAVVRSNRLAGLGVCGRRALNPEAPPVTPDDVWHLGSTTKSMTATLAAILVSRGRIGWNTTLAEVFPETAPHMAPGWGAVTLEQLCSNRSGAPTGLEANGLWGRLWAFHGTPEAARQYLLEQLTASPPPHTPGSGYEYSNAGFALAGHMLERVMKQSWEDLVTAELFRPLGIRTAGFGAPGREGSFDQPWGHHAGKPFLPQPPGPEADNPAAIAPAGRAYMALPDMARYVAFHLTLEKSDTPLLGAEAGRRLHRALPSNEHYAFGWFETRRKWAPGPILTHNGSNTMWFAVMWLAPDAEFGVIVTTNAGGPEAQLAADEAASALIHEFLPANP